MPHKGFFTQSAVVLLREPPQLHELEAKLGAFSVVRSVPESENWEIAGPSLIVAYRPDVNGYVSVDIVSRPWPDDMGDPAADNLVFSAWAMGHFGPCVFPGNLQRASEHSWTWEAGRSIAVGHQGFLRIRSSYIFGAEKDAKVLPQDYDALEELRFVTRLAQVLLQIPEAICYFNPNGEILMPADRVDQVMSRFLSGGVPALEVWTNVRFFDLGVPQWLFMDTVGMGQLDLPDQEIFFPSERYEPSEIDGFLRNISLYILQKGQVIRDGDTVAGPGGISWQGHVIDEGFTAPPRSVLRWFPLDGSTPPDELRSMLQKPAK